MKKFKICYCKTNWNLTATNVTKQLSCDPHVLSPPKVDKHLLYTYSYMKIMHGKSKYPKCATDFDESLTPERKKSKSSVKYEHDHSLRIFIGINFHCNYFYYFPIWKSNWSIQIGLMWVSRKRATQTTFRICNYILMQNIKKTEDKNNNWKIKVEKMIFCRIQK